jgi:tartrate dehydrogenase/decarboxylase/D-malate dehydrogenase
MVAKPQSTDTVVATNLEADVLSDFAAALSGSIGIAPTANLDLARMFPSMFEPMYMAPRSTSWVKASLIWLARSCCQ